MVTGPSFSRDTTMCPETACRHGYPEGADSVDELIVQGFSLFRPGRFDITGTAAVAGIAVQGELRNDQHLPAFIEEGVIEFPLVIFKDPQVDDLIGQVADVIVCILDGHAQEDRQAAAGLPCQDAVRRHRGLQGLLYDSSHAWLPPV